MSWLNGKKTYFLAAAAVLYAIFGVVSGNMDPKSAFDVAWAGLAAAALRHGVSTTLGGTSQQ